jgi:hypothetical protein
VPIDASRYWNLGSSSTRVPRHGTAQRNVSMAPGLYRAMAASVLSLHAAYIAWVIFGAFFTRGRPRLAALHVATLVYSLIIEIFGFWCRSRPSKRGLTCVTLNPTCVVFRLVGFSQAWRRPASIRKFISSGSHLRSTKHARVALHFGFCFCIIAATSPYVVLPQAHGCSGATTEPIPPAILLKE